MKKSIINISIIVIISILIFISGMYLYNRFYGIERYKYETVSTVNAEGDYTFLSGVIRNAGEGWYAIDDKSHEPVGINDVSQDSKTITIWYDKKSKINSISVTVDETMALEGYKVGASVGVDRTIIFIYDKNGIQVNPKNYTNSSGNIWIQGLFKE